MKRIILILSLGIPYPATAGDMTSMMTKLVDMRGEVEILGREVEADADIMKKELDLWVQKKLELEVQLQKETLRRIQLAEKLGRLKARVQAESATHPNDKAALLRWLERSKQWVLSSIPFRQEARLSVLADLESRSESGFESVESLSAELWQFMDSELKMAKSLDFRITDFAEPNQPPQKFEVVRLGIYTMFTKSPNDEYKQVLFSQGTWQTRGINEGSEQSSVERLFQNMRGKRRSGYHELPATEGDAI